MMRRHKGHRLGDGYYTTYEPSPLRRRPSLSPLAMVIIAVIGAPAIWYLVPLAMVIIKALGEML